MATLRQTPAGRGYESWLGYWSACNDYWSYKEECGGATCGNESMRDLWEQDRSLPPASGPTPGAPYLSRPAVTLTNPMQCSQNAQAGCTFEDDRLLSRATSIVRSHRASFPTAPLFLFWAAHAVVPFNIPLHTLLCCSLLLLNALLCGFFWGFAYKMMKMDSMVRARYRKRPWRSSPLSTGLRERPITH